MAPPRYRIHPAIGIARVGNAGGDKFFIGPEFPGVRASRDRSVGTLAPPYKEGGQLKPQAARFRVFEYVQDKGKWKWSREISLAAKDCVSLEWTVHLANRKASFFEFKNTAGEDRTPGPRRNPMVMDPRKLEIDPLPRKIAGSRAGPVEFRKGNSFNPSRELWPDPAPVPPITYLGELRTDDAGRLIVIGGKGLASGLPGQALIHHFNNPGWFDDVSDGPVTVELKMEVGGATKVVPVEGAWLICGPPDFAPGLQNPVTLYDVLYDMAARLQTLPPGDALFDNELSRLRDLNAELRKGPTLTKYVPSFDFDIFPILQRAHDQIFVSQLLGAAPAVGKARHGIVGLMTNMGDPSPGSEGVRKLVFDRLHPPGLAGTGGTRNMPLMHGDEFDVAGHARQRLTLTETQYAMLQRWVSGNFVKATSIPPPFEGWTTVISPHGLDRAALENCIGGAFCVGIETSWQIRSPGLYSGPFRIKHGAPSQYRGDTAGPIHAGHFSRQMALPWQTDFFSCNFQDGASWWPAVRPEVAYLTKADFDELRKDVSKSKPWVRGTPGNFPSSPDIKVRRAEFLQHYFKLGLIYEGKDRGYFLEQERNATVP